MPTYHEIMKTDLSALTTAADDWDGMAKKFHEQEAAYKRDVRSVSMGESWQGIAAGVADSGFIATHNEYKNAQTEAKAIASLLRDAHTQYVGLKKKLQAVRDGAVAADMKVSDQGLVTFSTTSLTQGERNALAHDPSYQEGMRKAVNSWQKRIDDAVKAVTDADDGVEAAFERVVLNKETSTGGFNGQAQGDIEKYEAEERKAEAARKADAEAQKQEKSDSTKDKLLRGIGSALNGATKPGDLGTKALTAGIEGIAGATGFNRTQGISLSGSIGFGVGIGFDVALVTTKKPDGGGQLNLMTSGSYTTAGWDFGASGSANVVKSNADDISQLKGIGWDKSASTHAGVGLTGSHQNAIGAVNSKGEDVYTASYGVGAGLGNEISTGFSRAWGWTLHED